MQYIAFDLGAGSGRVMLGSLEKEQLSLEEIHRFPDPYVTIDGSHYWQILRIYGELREGLAMLARRGVRPASVSCDSWGVDYVLIKHPAPLLCPPYQYRNPRTNGIAERLENELGEGAIYRETGIQIFPFNTIYQLVAHREADPDLLGFADAFVGIGDYMNFLFSGTPRMEVSLASTTALYNPRTRSWSESLIDQLKLPQELFPQIAVSGECLGNLRDPEDGMEDTRVIASCSHDTASAVAAVPVLDDGKDWAYLSSGTWSLLGVELPEPLINEDSQRLNFTNEVGYGHTIRFLKNISGLFVIQELKAEWALEGHEYDYTTLTRLAEEAEPFSFFIDPNRPSFATPGDMQKKIVAFCKETGQAVPTSDGAILRGVFESLALTYRHSMEGLESITGKKIERLHIVGGGSKNQLLNQFSANALGIEVMSGPDEATAMGNLLIQAIAMGEVCDLAHLRKIVRQSVETRTIQPENTEEWARAFGRFTALLESTP